MPAPMITTLALVEEARPSLEDTSTVSLISSVLIENLWMFASGLWVLIPAFRVSGETLPKEIRVPDMTSAVDREHLGASEQDNGARLRPARSGELVGVRNLLQPSPCHESNHHDENTHNKEHRRLLRNLGKSVPCPREG